MNKSINSFFKLDQLHTNIRTELVAGITTFMTMAYIIFVNSSMIAKTGMDFNSAMAATCISAAFATIFMGLYTNYPIALAAGMGQNAFFAYTVCLGMGISWQVALGCVFIEGVLFIILTATKIRQAIFDAIPACLRYAIACGIGLFIAFIGLIDAGIIVGNPATLVTLGDVVNPVTGLAILGLIVTAMLLARNIKGALLWGILVTAIIGIITGILEYNGLVAMPPSMAPTLFKMDIVGALNLGLLTVIFVFLFVDMFDTVGTLAGVGELGGFIKDNKMPRAGRAMLVDAVSTCVGASCGTPTVTSYIESSAGIAAGGRSGLTSVVTGLLFLIALFFSPFIRMIAGGCGNLNPVTAPALIIVGSFMLASITRINWKDATESIPAFMVIITIPLTFSIATGIGVGFVCLAAIKLLSGRGREVSWLVYFLAALFIIRFVYLKS